MQITRGVERQDIAKAAQLYWLAFGDKLGRVMGPEHRATAYIQRALGVDHAICAHDQSGKLIGIAGFKTYEGALVGGRLRDLAAVYGVVGAFWRAGLMALLVNDVDNERFLIDGLAVAPSARGQGVGTALLHAIFEEARRQGYAEVRLEVAGRNHRARALYERIGFVPVTQVDMGLLRHFFGFDSTTTMICRVV